MTTTKVSLNTIKLGNYSKGAYLISYAVSGTPLKPTARTYLTVGSELQLLDITGRSRFDVMGPDNLPQLLKLLEGGNLWGKSVSCSVLVKEGAVVVVKSNAESMACPVKPYSGSLNFDGIAREVPALTYPGNGHGRVWTLIDSKRYFRHGSLLETDNTKRGFDCTTFPMAMFECYPNMAGKYGTALADALGAVKCEMEQKKEADVKAFFASKGKLGLFFMWSAGHVVLVNNATVHEFTYGGYRQSPAASWGGYCHAAQGLWWVRKLTKTLPA